MVHYKLKPSDPTSFGHAVIGAMCGIILQQRFSGDKNSVFHGVEPSSGPGSPPIVSYGPCLQDLVSDAARVFDTSWHWKRAGELLEAPIKDLSQRPACTYLIGESGHAVLSGDGKWFPSSQAYIEHRLDSAVSRLPQEEKRAICDMIIAIAWAEEAGTSDSPDTLCESVMDYAARCSVELKKQTVPRALKAAFKKYGVFIPEMEEAGVVHRCSGCSAHPSPDVKLLSCPCKAVRYCSKLCQTTHWKSTHKLECPTASKKPSKSADTGGPAAGSRSVSGPAETNSRTSSKRKPSETAIAAAHKLLCSGKNDGRGPMPGSEAAEAWKECLRRFITASGLTLDDHAVETTRSALAEYERAEKAFFATYPNAPDWANGIEGSLSEPSAPASGGSAPSARSGGGTPSARSRGGAPSARSGGGAPSDPASGGGASSVRSEPWMDAYRTRTEDGSHHMGDLELVTWSCVDEYGQRFGWGGAVVEEVDEMKEKFEGEFGRSHAKLADYWPNAFRWTCCGMRLDEGNWGCDHHGDPRSPVPCKCDFCRAGKPVPERIHKKRAENGLQLRRGPDLRSGSAAGSMNFALRQMFMGSD